MSNPTRPIRIALLGLALGLLAPMGLVRAQDDEEEVVVAPRHVQVVRMLAPGIDDSNFDRWVYGGRINGDVREWFDAKLAMKLDEVDRVCGMDESQKAKLLLAGRGDIKHFLNVYDEKRRNFQAVKRDQNKVGEVLQDIVPLQSSLASGLFGPSSLFEKATKATLTPDQALERDQDIRRRREYRRQARIGLAIAFIDANLGLDADQARRLREVLEAETTPGASTGQYDYYLIMYQMAQLPEARLRPIFDDAQWKVVSKMLVQARGFKSVLRAGGHLPPDPVAPVKEPRR